MWLGTFNNIAIACLEQLRKNMFTTKYRKFKSLFQYWTPSCNANWYYITVSITDTNRRKNMRFNNCLTVYGIQVMSTSQQSAPVVSLCSRQEIRMFVLVYCITHTRARAPTHTHSLQHSTSLAHGGVSCQLHGLLSCCSTSGTVCLTTLSLDVVLPPSVLETCIFQQSFSDIVFWKLYVFLCFDIPVSLAIVFAIYIFIFIHHKS